MQTQKIQFENICLFLAHIIIADGEVDIKETLLLNDFISINSLDPLLKDEIFRIVSRDQNHITLADILERLRISDQYTQEQALIAALIMAYGDGEYHPREEEIIARFLDITDFNPERYRELRAVAQVQAEADRIHEAQKKSSTEMEDLED